MSICSSSINPPDGPVNLGSLDVRELQAFLYREIGLSAVAAELFGTGSELLSSTDLDHLLLNLGSIARAA